jgi:hypothetical protein
VYEAAIAVKEEEEVLGERAPEQQNSATGHIYLAASRVESNV